MAQTVKRLPAMQGTWVLSLGWEDPLEKEMAIHSSIFAWKIPWMEEPGRLQSMGLQRVRHDWTTSSEFFFFWMVSQKPSKKKWQTWAFQGELDSLGRWNKMIFQMEETEWSRRYWEETHSWLGWIVEQRSQEMILERNQTFEEVLMHFEQKNLESVFFRTPLGVV